MSLSHTLTRIESSLGTLLKGGPGSGNGEKSEKPIPALLLDTAKTAIEFKTHLLKRMIKRRISRSVHQQLTAKVERQMQRVLIPFFKEQVEEMASRLEKMDRKELEDQLQTKSTTPPKLLNKIFDPKDWKDELVNRLLPIMAVGMAKAMVGQMLAMGVDIRQPRRRKDKTNQVKTTTATDWLNENPNDLAAWEELIESIDVDGMSILTELPPQMKRRIAKHLNESFSQDYWDGISATTGGNAETILREGLRDGWSIVDMAKELRASLGGDSYARVRAFNIARTESGNALNGARSGVMDQLMEDLGEEVPVKKVWLSVLGTTTRDTHANLDGVPADKNGNWNLSGYRIPWPGHVSLPPGERCNCQCTLSYEWGMRDEDAQRLIEDYYAGSEEKGGPGSGNFGHEGRPGSIGGSGGGGGGYGTGPEAKIQFEQRGLKHEDVAGWRGVNGYIGNHAVADYLDNQPGISSLVAVNEKGKTVGVMSYHIQRDNYISLNYFATNETSKGVGSRMMQELCKVAVKEGKGVKLWAADEAVPFYQKMGMESKREFHFAFSPQQAKEFAELGYQKKAVDDFWDELAELEPKSGAYATKPEVTEKGGPGSGNFGHQGRPGHIGGSGGGGGGGSFDENEWKNKPVPQRRDDWAKLPVAKRDKLADAPNSVPQREREHLKGLPERPSTDNLQKDISTRVEHFADRVHPEARQKLASITKTYEKDLKDAGVDDDTRRELTMKALESVAAQEIEACGRQLGDHGVAHIEGNIRIARAVLDEVPGAETARDLAIVSTAMMFHDAGYLTKPSQMFMDEGHPRWSAEHYDENVKPLIVRAFGKRDASEVEHIIRTHDSTDIDWGNNPLASASRVADNLALFHQEKTPPLLRYVPENVAALKKLASKEVSLEQTHATMKKNIDASDLPPKIKERLKVAVDEVSPITPKMSLGMLGGELSGVKWNGTGIDIKLKERPEYTELNKLGDFGQRQFAKFAETYGADPQRFKQDLSFEFKDRSGNVILRATQEKGSKGYKGGPGSGNFGHQGRPGSVGGSGEGGGGVDSILADAIVKARESGLTSEELGECESSFRLVLKSLSFSKGLQDRVREGVKEIEFVKDHVALGAIASKHSLESISGPVGGMYLPPGRLILAPGSRRGIPSNAVYAHEIGHAIDSGGKDKFSESAAWKDAYTKDHVWEGRLGKYAKKSESEGFAEFCRYLHTEGVESVKQTAPNCWKAFHRRFVK